MSWVHKTRVAGVRGPLGYRPTNKEDTRGLANFFLCASTDKEKGVEGFGVKDSKLLLQKKKLKVVCQEEGKEVFSVDSLTLLISRKKKIAFSLAGQPILNGRSNSLPVALA